MWAQIISSIFIVKIRIIQTVYHQLYSRTKGGFEASAISAFSQSSRGQHETNWKHDESTWTRGHGQTMIRTNNMTRRIWDRTSWRDVRVDKLRIELRGCDEKKRNKKTVNLFQQSTKWTGHTTRRTSDATSRSQVATRRSRVAMRRIDKSIPRADTTSRRDGPTAQMINFVPNFTPYFTNASLQLVFIL